MTLHNVGRNVTFQILSSNEQSRNYSLEMSKTYPTSVRKEVPNQLLEQTERTGALTRTRS